MSKKTVETIIDSGNNYIIQVKRNQKVLHDDIQHTMAHYIPLDMFQLEEKSHGRRSLWSVSVFSVLPNEKNKKWKDLKRYIHVHKEVRYNPKRRKRHTISDRLYISSLMVGDAKFFHQSIRKHWSIENKLHWVKDVIHNEDKNQMNTRNGPVNNSIISTISINIHRKNGSQSITDSQIKFGANIKELFHFYKNA